VGLLLIKKNDLQYKCTKTSKFTKWYFSITLIYKTDLGMELRQLKYFIRAAELNNFTEAASNLFISQSTLSQQIKQLEDDLGIPLFNRLGKRVSLTEAGERFLPYARQTYLDAERSKLLINDLKALKTGVLKIGVTYGLSGILTPILIEFAEKYSDIKLVIELGTSQELLQKLEIGSVDFLLSFVDVKNNKQFETITLYESELALVAHPTNKYAKQKVVQLKDLQEIPLVLPANGFHTRGFLNAALAKQNIQPNVKIELNDIPILLELVATGKWCTIMTVAAAQQKKQLKTIPIKGLHIKSKASITWPKDVYKKKAAQIFTEMIMHKV
jgi:LysR family transcriptional regulator, cyn operon transcriptional activator